MRDFLRGLHNDFPFFSKIIKAEKNEKLVANIHDKNVILHT